MIRKSVLLRNSRKKFSQIFAEKVADSRRDHLSFFYNQFCENLRLTLRKSARKNYPFKPN